MRLLFVSHSFPPPGQPLANLGGMQRVATELYAALGQVPGLSREGLLLHTSWALTPPRTVLFLPRVRARLRREARRPTVDAVLFSSMVTASTAVGLSTRLRQAGVVTAAITHGLDVTTPFGPYQRFVPRVFDALDRVLPVSHATAEACRLRGADPAKLVVVPNGVDTHRLEPPQDRTEARRLLRASLQQSLPDDAFVLLSVGRHVRRKGFAWFAESVMPRLPAHVHWVLVGEGPETPAVQAAVAAHGLAGQVHLTGRAGDDLLRRLYEGADLFVMPNRPVPGDMEGFGVVMLEAGLGGMPTVGAALEGILDVIAEGENGQLVPSGDAEAFAGAITHYVRDRGALDALSARTAAYTRETFAWEAVARRYVEVLKIAEGRRTSE
ncbi:MAG TPA: glycosyltransferase family 4 protein [Rhodothermales bacterium]|nr:glycosyltransferase family 4 protein [Rhodothermales bacterium]